MCWGVSPTLVRRHVESLRSVLADRYGRCCGEVVRFALGVDASRIHRRRQLARDLCRHHAPVETTEVTQRAKFTRIRLPRCSLVVSATLQLIWRDQQTRSARDTNSLFRMEEEYRMTGHSLYSSAVRSLIMFERASTRQESEACLSRRMKAAT